MRLAVIVASALAVQGAAFKATLAGGGHTPQVNTRWAYTVRATTSAGKPLEARLTAQVVDPLGTAHPVEFFTSKKHVTNILFRGTFRNAVTWPPESRGFPLTFRVTVKVGTAKRVLRYTVTPR
jgi:hypothetical protein